MMDKILYVADKSDMLFNYYSLFYHPSYKELQRSTPSAPQEILLIPKRISLWISERIVLPLFESIVLEFDQYLVICVFAGFQLPSQFQRHSAQAKVALVYVLLSALTP